jgi:hypothetical protein
VPYVRTVKTASGATAVQIVYSSNGGRGISSTSAWRHDDAELELLKAAARQRLAAGQGELDLGLDAGAAGGPLTICASQASAAGIPCSSLWAAIRPATATAPSRP